MKLKKRIVQTTLVLAFLLTSYIGARANTLYPYKNELLLTNKERSIESVFLRNENNKEIYITPLVYSFNPQTLQITDNQNYVFVRTDKDTFKVRADETFELKYEVVPTESFPNGTYFNLIILQAQHEDSILNQTNPVSLSDSLSQLVVLHVSDGDVYGITNEFANISLEIVENGIPFIRPTRIKYVYQNITNYVLQPEGEIQVYNKKGSYAPEYIKINDKEEKLYPGGVMEEEFEINKYALTDVFNERTIVGRFYNGIDENFIIKEIQQETSYLFLGSMLVIGVSLIFLVKSVIKERVFSKKKSA